MDKVATSADAVAAIRQTYPGPEGVDARPTLALQQAVGLRLAPGMPWLVAPTGAVCKYINHPMLAALPNVQPWFVGVYSEEGVLVPVFDLIGWSTAASKGSAAGGGMTLISDGALHLGLICPEPPVVLSVMLDQAGPELPEGVPESLADFLGMEGLHTDLGAAFSFDPFAWLKQIANSVLRPA